MLRTAPLRVLDDTDLPAVREILARDPVSNVFVASRVGVAGLDPWRLGGEMWGYFAHGHVESICYAGANLVPVGNSAEVSPEALRVFADRARRQGRRCSSIVGPADLVGALWDMLEPHWGPARDVRTRQPVMVARQPPAVAPDPAVRRVKRDELGILLPACVQMFTEEVGVSPNAGDGGTLYRSRVAELVNAGRAFARIENGSVLFKAEIGAVSTDVCQVQGVWVRPDLRGQGLSVGGMAAVLAEAQRSIAPVVSLYVNDFNAPARAAYRHVGFADEGMFMSVLF
jgi:predicted GNAT family acetyltransferase